MTKKFFYYVLFACLAGPSAYGDAESMYQDMDAHTGRVKKDSGVRLNIFGNHLLNLMQKFNQKLENDSKNGQDGFSDEVFNSFFDIHNDIYQRAAEYTSELILVQDHSSAESKSMKNLLQQCAELHKKYNLVRSNFIRAANKIAGESNELFVKFISNKIEAISKNSYDLFGKFYQNLEKKSVKSKDGKANFSAEEFNRLLKMQNEADLLAIEYTLCVHMVQENAFADMKIGEKIYKQGVMLHEQYTKAKSDFSKAREEAF